MGKSKNRGNQQPRAERNTSKAEDDFLMMVHARKQRDSNPLEPQTEGQREMLSAMDCMRYVFGVGPAGSGKTYLASRYAASRLKDAYNPDGDIETIYLCRSPVEVGPKVGYLPGTYIEKVWPYLQPFFKGLCAELGLGDVMAKLKSGRIAVMPLAYMQGISFDERCIVLLDEAQNTTPEEMKMFLTRLGKGAQMVITGDTDQKMIQGKSGLIDGMQLLQYTRYTKIVQFSEDENVRSDEVQEVVRLYRERDERQAERQKQNAGDDG